MQTYWIDFAKAASFCAETSSTQLSDSSTPNLQSLRHGGRRDQMRRMERLIDWNVDVLCRLLRNVVAMRDAKAQRVSKTSSLKGLAIERSGDATVLDEVAEIIKLPGKAAKYKQDPNSVELGPEVRSQLKDYVKAIAGMYRENPFHTFDHASHVTQSVTKLLA